MSLDKQNEINNISKDTKQLVELAENLDTLSSEDKLNTIIHALGSISTRLDGVMQEQSHEKKEVTHIKSAMESAKVDGDFLFEFPAEENLIPGKHVQLWVNHCQKIVSKWNTHYRKDGYPDEFLISALTYTYYIENFLHENKNWTREASAIYRKVSKAEMNELEALHEANKFNGEYRDLVKYVYLYRPWCIPNENRVYIKELKELDEKKPEFLQNEIDLFAKVEKSPFRKDSHGSIKNTNNGQIVEDSYIEASEVVEIFIDMSLRVTERFTNYDEKYIRRICKENSLVAELMDFIQKHIYPLMDLVSSTKRKEEILDKYKKVFYSYPL